MSCHTHSAGYCELALTSSVEMLNKSIAVDAYTCLCIRRLELLHKAIALTAMLLHRVATEPFNLTFGGTPLVLSFSIVKINHD